MGERCVRTRQLASAAAACCGLSKRWARIYLVNFVAFARHHLPCAEWSRQHDSERESERKSRLYGVHPRIYVCDCSEYAMCDERTFFFGCTININLMGSGLGRCCIVFAGRSGLVWCTWSFVQLYVHFCIRIFTCTKTPQVWVCKHVLRVANVNNTANGIALGWWLPMNWEHRYVLIHILSGGIVFSLVTAPT